MLVLWFKLFVLVCTSLRTVRLDECLHQLAIAVEHRRLAGIQRFGVGHRGDKLLKPLAHLVHLLDAVEMTSTRSDQLSRNTRVFDILDVGGIGSPETSEALGGDLNALPIKMLTGLLGIFIE